MIISGLWIYKFDKENVSYSTNKLLNYISLFIKFFLFCQENTDFLSVSEQVLNKYYNIQQQFQMNKSQAAIIKKQPKSVSAKKLSNVFQRLSATRKILSRQSQSLRRNQSLNIFTQLVGQKSNAPLLKTRKSEQNLDSCKIIKKGKSPQSKIVKMNKHSQKQWKHQTTLQSQKLSSHEIIKGYSKKTNTEVKKKKIDRKIINGGLQFHQANREKQQFFSIYPIAKQSQDDYNGETSITMENNPQMAEKDPDKKMSHTQKQPSYMILSNNLSSDSKSVSNLQMMSVVSVNLSPQGFKNQKELLQQELTKYKNQCLLLQNELRETLQTVKVITDQLETANAEKRKQQKPLQNDRYDKVEQVQKNDYKTEVIYDNIQHNSQIDKRKQIISPAEQIRHNAKVYAPIYTTLSSQELNSQNQKIIRTISPIVISSSSPRIIRIGNSSSTCARGCTPYCTCLCP